MHNKVSDILSNYCVLVSEMSMLFDVYNIYTMCYIQGK